MRRFESLARDLGFLLPIAVNAILSHLMRSKEGGEVVGDEGALAGSARLVLSDGVALLRPDEQVFEAMLEGWRNQGLARNLARSTVQARERQVRAFQAHAGVFPWEWAAVHADEWFADLRAVHHCTRSTVRGYQVAVRGFCAFAIDPAYGWAEECMRWFGAHPVQIITDVNSGGCFISCVRVRSRTEV